MAKDPLPRLLQNQKLKQKNITDKKRGRKWFTLCLQRSKRFNFQKGGALQDSIHTCNPLFNKGLEGNSETGKEGRKEKKKSKRPYSGG